MISGTFLWNFYSSGTFSLAVLFSGTYLGATFFKWYLPIKYHMVSGTFPCGTIQQIWAAHNQHTNCSRAQVLLMSLWATNKLLMCLWAAAANELLMDAYDLLMISWAAQEQLVSSLAVHELLMSGIWANEWHMGFSCAHGLVINSRAH